MLVLWKSSAGVGNTVRGLSKQSTSQTIGLEDVDQTLGCGGESLGPIAVQDESHHFPCHVQSRSRGSAKFLWTPSLWPALKHWCGTLAVHPERLIGVATLKLTQHEYNMITTNLTSHSVLIAKLKCQNTSGLVLEQLYQMDVSTTYIWLYNIYIYLSSLFYTLYICIYMHIIIIIDR